MNSRERLLAALAGKETDRVPISTYELCEYNSKAWENKDPSYARLMEAIREMTDCVCMWEPVPKVMARSVSQEDAVALSSGEVFLESGYPIEIDTEKKREGKVTIIKKTLHTPKGDLTQTLKMVEGLHTTWQVEHWCKSLEDVDRALSVPYEPLEYDASDYTRIKKEVGDHGIIMATIADPLWLAADLGHERDGAFR